MFTFNRRSELRGYTALLIGTRNFACCYPSSDTGHLKSSFLWLCTVLETSVTTANKYRS